jgi:hypothetical protein
MLLAEYYLARNDSGFAAYMALQRALLLRWLARGGTEQSWCDRLAPRFRERYAGTLLLREVLRERYGGRGEAGEVLRERYCGRDTAGGVRRERYCGRGTAGEIRREG